ncbi:unnamed protein product [Closterium sp. Naga37s-1]|nr:unnamed protein product [Closterium sp. Naga37s-1]
MPWRKRVSLSPIAFQSGLRADEVRNRIRGRNISSFHPVHEGPGKKGRSYSPRLHTTVSPCDDAHARCPRT